LLPREYIKCKALVVYWSFNTEGEEPTGDGALGAFGRAVSSLAHIFTRTRWERLLHQIR
jgi:hypothetical protein